MIGTDIPKRETRDLWVAIAIALSLGVYHLLFNIISFLQNISYQYYQLLSNLLFFWIVALLWVAYRRWRNAVYRQRELRNILASIKPEVIMVVDSRRRIQMANESVNMFGYSPEEVIKKTTDLLYIDRRIDKNRPIEIRDSINKIGFHIGQATGRKRTGETFPLEIMTVSLKGSESVVVVIRDISERKQAESDRQTALDALRKSEDKYRTLIETTETGYVIIDQNGLVRDANSEYVRLTGHHNLSEIVGRSVMEWTAESEKEKNAEAMKACFDKGYIRNLEIDYVDAKGNITPIEINATCIEIEGKTHTMTICRDITERKKNKELIAVLNEQQQIMLDASPAMIFYKDKENRFIRVNEALAKANGISERDGR